MEKQIKDLVVGDVWVFNDELHVVICVRPSFVPYHLCVFILGKFDNKQTIICWLYLIDQVVHVL
jgi:hypothetical protein